MLQVIKLWYKTWSNKIVDTNVIPTKSKVCKIEK